MEVFLSRLQDLVLRKESNKVISRGWEGLVGLKKWEVLKQSYLLLFRARRIKVISSG